LFLLATTMKKRKANKSLSMGRQASFDWQVREDSPQGVAETVASIAAPPRRQPWALWVVATLVVMVAGYWGADTLLRRAEAELDLVEADVAQVMPAEVIPAEGAFRPPNLAHINAQIAEEWGEDVSLIELHMDMALVNVVIDQPSEAWFDGPYRVARVLRQDGKGWQLIEPAYSFWSERRTLDTDYFAIDFSRRDEDTVRAIVADLEANYLRLHEDLSLPAPVPGQRVPIRIGLVEGSAVRVTDLSYSGDTLIIPPPDLVPRPLDLSNVEVLRQTITYALAVRLYTESQTQVPAPCTWSGVAEGVGVWLRWEDHHLPSRRKWIYESTIHEWRTTSNVPQLADLLAFPLNCSRPPTILEIDVLNSGRPIPRPELAATLVDYMVTLQGREIVPQILAGLGEVSDWDDLAQRTVNLSAEELEAGWQAHLLAEAP
jgi:hypothetical protein